MNDLGEQCADLEQCIQAARSSQRPMPYRLRGFAAAPRPKGQIGSQRVSPVHTNVRMAAFSGCWLADCWLAGQSGQGFGLRMTALHDACVRMAGWVMMSSSWLTALLLAGWVP